MVLKSFFFCSVNLSGLLRHSLLLVSSGFGKPPPSLRKPRCAHYDGGTKARRRGCRFLEQEAAMKRLPAAALAVFAFCGLFAATASGEFIVHLIDKDIIYLVPPTAYPTAEKTKDPSVVI